MRTLLPSLALLALAALPATARPVKWTATASVTSVTAAAYPGVNVGDPVTVEFSYDSEATLRPISMIPIGSSVLWRAEYYNAIQLKIAATIGAQRWEGNLPDTTAAAIQCESWDGAGSPDTFTLTTSSTASATFPSFPYAGTGTSRSLQIILKDTVAPCDFLVENRLPKGSTDVSQITEGTGRIAAGIQSINFALNLASIAVVEEGASFPLSIEKTPNGVRIFWLGESGKLYTLQHSDDCSNWTDVNDGYFGTGSEISVTLTPFAAYPERRFYRVVSSD